ncbi:MAG: hypothetical protein ACC656_04175 [Candidatus Heimdallarchaeota archaeon]
MLIEHLNLLPCPVCNEFYTWSVDGITHENQVLEGKVTCGNGQSWKVVQEILRFDKEESSEDIIYSDREKTGYPKQVREQERLPFLDFIDSYFKSIKFDHKYVLVSGEPVLLYRYLEDKSKHYITIYDDEGVLRQLHETAVGNRMHENHSFIRSQMGIQTDITNKLIIFPKRRVNSIPAKSLILQFIPISEETKGKIIWTGEEYKLEELTNIM